MPDALCRRLGERGLADGSLLAFRIDVTERVEKERVRESRSDPAAEGQEPTWPGQRLYRHRHADPPGLQELPGNRWLRIEERPTRLDGVAGVRVDVTGLVQQGQQLKQGNARLAEGRARLSAVISTATAAIVTLDARGEIASANPATTMIFGWPEHELVGQDIGGLLPLDKGDADLLAPWSPRRAAGHSCAPPRWPERHGAAGAVAAGDPRLDRALHEEWRRSGRHGRPVALPIVAGDHFKRYHDSLGHPLGDECRRAIAQILRQCAPHRRAWWRAMAVGTSRCRRTRHPPGRWPWRWPAQGRPRRRRWRRPMRPMRRSVSPGAPGGAAPCWPGSRFAPGTRRRPAQKA